MPLIVTDALCYDVAPPSQHDACAPPPRGGRVLAAHVEATEATRIIETFFDLPSDSTCARRLPPFPSRDALGPFRLGVLTGPSGAAKSALLASQFGRAALDGSAAWRHARRLSDAFGSSEQAARCLRAVAAPLPSALAWRHGACSSGERAQALLALEIGAAEPAKGDGGGAGDDERSGARLALFDEFGSAWDGDTTLRISRALSCALRASSVEAQHDDASAEAHVGSGGAVVGAGGAAARPSVLRCAGVVLAGCHIEHVARGALEPDWIFEAASATCFWLQPTAATRAEGAEAEGAEAEAEATRGVEKAMRGVEKAAAAAGAAAEAAANATAHEAMGEAATAHETMGLRGWLALAAARAPLAANPSVIKVNQEAIKRQSKVISDPLAANPSAAGASTSASGFVDGGSVRLPFPQLALRLRPCAPAEWQRFHSYHYKTAQLSTVASTCLLEARVALGARAEAAPTRLGTAAADAEDAHHDAEAVASDAEDEASVYVPAGFVATIPHSGKPTSEATDRPQRAHRTVVLPEFQGFGVGARLSDAVGEWLRRRGSDFYGQTVHPRFGAYRDASPLWEPTAANHTMPELRWLPRRLTGAGGGQAVAVRRQHPRMVYAHRYVGARPGDAAAARHLHARVEFE